MTTDVHFEEIAYHITSELKKARESIYLAVAWFTDFEFFDIICQKAGAGVSVEVMLLDDEINLGAWGLDFEKLRILGGKVFFLKTSDEGEGIMHNKFCVIDENVAITGSYNWSRKARRNRENITVIKDAPDLIVQFLEEYDRIKLHFNISQEVKTLTKIHYDKIFGRLKAILQLVELNDFDDIEGQLVKIERLLPDDKDDDFTHGVHEILSMIRDKSYSVAEDMIQSFISRHQQIVVHGDIDIPGLEFEKEMLSVQVSALEEEKSDVLRIIRRFEVRYNLELGDLILEILELKKEISQQSNDEEAFEEANNQYNRFKKNYQQLSIEGMNVLSEEEELEIKKLFKKASKLCHPDLVKEAFKDNASQSFIELRNAFETGNLKKVKEILEELEAGNWIKSTVAIINAKFEQLKHQVSVLRKKVAQLTDELLTLKNTESYQIISSIQDWDAYFSDARIRLEEELKVLKSHEPVNQD